MIKLEGVIKKFQLEKEEGRPLFLKWNESIKHQSQKLETAKLNLKEAEKACSHQVYTFTRLKTQIKIRKKAFKSINLN